MQWPKSLLKQSKIAFAKTDVRFTIKLKIKQFIVSVALLA